ncbi:MAG TPA: hypothetical protein DEV93_14025 [Chloroflexi bacterium]|jgi:hypothetical protein|nr:hypothetical protein [Chloroflexota bacterium]
MSSEVHSGSKNVYGIPLGILMLRSRFPRVPGDAGNASTWPFPVVFRVVDGTSPGLVVRHLPESGLLNNFVACAHELAATGVAMITTNCGFLVLYQSVIQAELKVPFISSSLLQVPFIASILPPGRQVGLLTIARSSLSAEHLKAAGIEGDIPTVGMEEVGGYFAEAILGDASELDTHRASEEHVAAAGLLIKRHPSVAAIVLECTNMPPYASAITQATGLPVHDLTTLVRWQIKAMRRVRFEGWM